MAATSIVNCQYSTLSKKQKLKAGGEEIITRGRCFGGKKIVLRYRIVWYRTSYVTQGLSLLVRQASVWKKDLDLVRHHLRLILFVCVPNLRYPPCLPPPVTPSLLPLATLCELLLAREGMSCFFYCDDDCLVCHYCDVVIFVALDIISQSYSSAHVINLQCIFIILNLK